MKNIIPPQAAAMLAREKNTEMRKDANIVLRQYRNKNANITVTLLYSNTLPHCNIERINYYRVISKQEISSKNRESRQITNYHKNKGENENCHNHRQKAVDKPANPKHEVT